jgi:hypothetical protein
MAIVVETNHYKNTSFSVSHILSEIEILRFAQNDILCHPERSEGSSLCYK